MNIKLKRHYFGPEYTIGRVSIDTVKFCDSLEDTVREFGPNGEGKIKKQTAIPAGTYKVIMSYSPRFKQQMPLLVDVPFFSGILIHDGKDKDSTEGCLIVGLNTIKGQLTESKSYYRKLRALIMDAERQHEPIFITVE